MKNLHTFFASLCALVFTANILSAQESDCAAVTEKPPGLNQGQVQGSIQVLKPQQFSINSGAIIEGDLLVPGTPNINVNGNGDGFGGVEDSDGSANPKNYGINVNSPVQLRKIIRRVDPIVMPQANEVLPIQGNQWINLNQGATPPASFANVRGINVNNGYGDLILPPGSYQQVNINGGHNLILGNEGDTEPVVYSFHNLGLNQNSDLIVRGPIELRLKNSFNIHGTIGNDQHPEWLTVHLKQGGINLNTSSTLIGTVIAPKGNVHINNGSILKGQVFTRKLVVNGGGKLICALGGSDSVNEAPIAQNGSAETQEGVAVAIALVGTDPENVELGYNIETPPTNGSLSGTAPNLIYTPNANFDGPDQLTFTVSDGELTSVPAIFNLTINPVNHPPSVNDFTVQLNEDEVDVAVALQGTDTDGDALTFTVLTQPANGALSGSGQNLSFTPSADFNGSDSFTYKVNDGEFDSAIAIVTLQINEVNDAPTSEDQNFTTNEDTPLELTLRAEDKDNGVEDFVFTIVDQASNGILEVPENAEKGEYLYTPSANFNGEDTFTFTVGDGELTTEVFTVTITLVPVNDAPVANAGTLTVAEDAAESFVPSGNDVDGDSITFEVVIEPTNGALTTNTDGSFLYTPSVNYNGTDSFTYKANDGGLDSAPVEVSVAITPANDVPVAEALAGELDEDSSITLTLSGSDLDEDVLSFEIVTQPENGTLTLTGDQVVYTPSENYNGTDSFTYIAKDAVGSSASALVSLTVNPVNDVPVANAGRLTVEEDSSVIFTPTGSDIDGDQLTFTVVTTPSNGTISSNVDGAFLYTPSSNYNGLDSFTFTANDGMIDSAPIEVAITITEKNDIPVAQALTSQLDEDVAATITLSGSDLDGDDLTFEITIQPQHGTLTLAGEQVVYMPNENYNGSDEFAYTAKDALESSIPATVSLTVNPVNDAPVLTAEALTVAEDTALTFTPQVNDVDGDSYMIEIVSPPSNGSVSVNIDGSVIYEPSSSYSGDDSFVLIAKDVESSSEEISFSVVVTEVNDFAVPASQTLELEEDTFIDFALSARDEENDALTYVITIQPEHGVLTELSGNRFRYRPEQNYNGSDKILFVAKDRETDDLTQFEVGEVMFNVMGDNDRPLANSVSLTTDEDSVLVVDLPVSDAEGDALLAEIQLNGNNNFTLEVVDGVKVRVTPKENFNGDYFFDYRVREAQVGGLVSDTKRIQIEYVPQNDSPIANDVLVEVREDSNGQFVFLSAVDPDGDSVMIDVVVPADFPGQFSSSFGVNRYLFVPAEDYFGSYELIYTATDGTLTSTGTVSFNVLPVNDRPRVESFDLVVEEDEEVTFTLQITEVEGDAYTIENLASSSTAVSVVVNPDLTLTITPNENFTGFTSITYDVVETAPGGLSTRGIGSVRYTPVNDLPLAVSKTVEIDIDGSPRYLIPLEGSDVESVTRNFFYRLVQKPNEGSGIISGAGMLYTPPESGATRDQFTFRTFDGELYSEVATINLILNYPEETDPSLIVDAGEDRFIKISSTRSENAPLRELGNQLPSSGKEFWLTFLPNANEATEIQENLRKEIYISALTEANVQITNQEGTSTTYTILPNELIAIPVAAGLTSYSGERFHILSDAEISVQAISSCPAKSDAFSVFPLETLGLEYYIQSYSDRDDALHPPGFYSVIATEDSTNVQLTTKIPAVYILNGVPIDPDTPVTENVEFSIVLNRGDILHVDTNQGRPHKDVSGSYVVADKPLAVFAGNPVSFIGGFAADHLVEQMIPVEHWGKEYIAMYLPRLFELFRVIASQDNTELTIDGVVVATLSAGEVFQFDHIRSIGFADSPRIVRADKPISLVQFAQGASVAPPNTTSPGIGDPFMMNVTPVENFSNRYALYTQAAQYFENYVTVVAPKSEIGRLTLDGKIVASELYVKIQNTGYYGANVPVESGLHYVESKEPFGCYAFGYGSYDSYAYTSGFGRQFYENVANVELFASNETQQTLTSSELIAQVKDSAGQPVAGVEVTFSISGANQTQVTETTDVAGVATARYTGFVAGEDTVTATINDLSDIKLLQWEGSGIVLDGSALVSNLPTGVTPTYLWQLVDGPFDVQILAPTQLQTEVAIFEPGTYNFELSATAGTVVEKDEVILRVVVDGGLVVDAGLDQTINLPFTANLSGRVSSPFEALGGEPEISWELISGPDGNVSVFSPSGEQSEVSFSSPGQYRFALTGSILDQQLTDEVDVLVLDPVNATPVAKDAFVQTDTDRAVSLILVASSPASDPISYTLTSQPQNGSLTGIAPFLQYQPNVGYTGSDSFAFTATNIHGTSTEATIQIVVNNPNGQPVITQSYLRSWTVYEESDTNNDDPIYRSAIAVTDPDGDALDFELRFGPVGMTVDPQTGELVWDTTSFAVGTYEVNVAITDRESILQEVFEIELLRNAKPIIPSYDVLVDRNTPVSLNLTAQDTDGDDLTYSFVESPLNGVINGNLPAITYTPNSGFLGQDTIRVAVSDGFNTDIVSTLSISIVAPGNVAPIVDLGADRTINLQRDISVTLSAQVSDDGLPLNGTFTALWQQISGPGTATFTTPDLLDTEVSVDRLGTYVFRHVANDGQLESSDDLAVTFTASTNRTPSIIPSLPAPSGVFNATARESIDLLIEVRDDGLLKGEDLIYTWSVLTAAGDVNFSDAQAESPLITFDQAGEYILRLEAFDGDITGRRNFSFVVSPPVNKEPIILLSDRVFVELNNGVAPFELSAVIQDDDLVIPLTQQWTWVSGPEPVAITNAESARAQVEFTRGGIYTFSIDVFDGQFRVQRQIEVTVQTPGNEAPVVNAGTDQAIDFAAGGSFTLQGTATDDGIPTAGELSTTWIIQRNDGDAILESPDSLTSNVTVSTPGIYTFELQASDGELIFTDAVVVRVSEAPQLSYQDSDPILTLVTGGNADIRMFASDRDGTVERVEYFIDGILVGEAFKLPNQIDEYQIITAPNLPLGDYVLSAVAVDNEGLRSEPIIKTLSIKTADDFNEFVRIEILSPSEDDVITNKTGVGAILDIPNLQEFDFQFRGEEVTEWTVFAERKRRSANGQGSAIFDPTILKNGVYELRIVATTPVAQFTSPSVSVVVDGQMKVGQFSLAFEDLSIPLEGVPLTVTRTYDSRETDKSDFGLGWNLGIKDIRVRKTTPLGEGWAQTRQQTQAGVIPVFISCLEPVGNKRVVLTFPDGRTEIFQARVNVSGPKSFGGSVLPSNCVYFQEATEGQIEFDPVSTNSRNATQGKLEAIGGEFTYPRGVLDTPANFLLFQEPDLFRYTDNDGTIYVISEQNGLRSVTDTNDNTLTVNDDGLIHSSGESVLFTRNTSGFITAVTDPAGNQIFYAYDAQDRLISVTNRVGDTTTFLYELPERPNYLTCIEDPRGIEAIRSEYDDDGRLLRQIDADGNAITFENSVGSNQRITDRLGNVTTHIYDSRGNVTRTNRPLGSFTFYQYDDNDNEIRISTNFTITRRQYDDQNNVTLEFNSLGERTSYTYRNDQRPLSISDPLGNITDFAYTGNGNLTQMTDAVNANTGFTYDGSGNLSSLTDAVGTTTSYTHDGKGRELTMLVADADGNTLRSEAYTYDDNGNRLTSSTTRTLADGTVETLTTSFVYDAENRVTQTTYPDNSTTSTVYNSIGKAASTTDQLGRVTTYAYDNRGNQISMTYPDATTSSMTYDVENRQTSTTNQIGETTYMVYDALGRQTATIYPDGTMPTTILVEVADIEASPELADNPRTLTEYDADSRVIASIDALGNRTEFEYDAAGRRILVRDALGQETRTEYDRAGRQIATIDAKDQRTEFTYDAASRLTLTTFADGTTASTEYDALGRRSSVTDQENNTTSFEYDALGRLVAVVDALNQRTTYEYDEQGSQLIQRDALGRETAYSYDQLGRRIGRTLPSGEAESMAYNVLGNMISRTDFNGHTTSYVYDIMNRVTSMTADASHPSLALEHAPRTFTYEYDLLGRRTAAESLNSSDESLYRDQWEFDERGRLIAHGSSHGTLGYSYDDNSNMLTAQSDADKGYNQGYQYDVLNRLSGLLEADPVNPEQWQSVSGYTYDANGNLAGVGYRNQVTHGYTYSALNRLTNLAVDRQATGAGGIATALQGYRYTLNRAGHRTQIAELNGRTITNAFDKLYRLTSENITGSLSGLNGLSTYGYDAVGNRNTRTSTVSALDNQSFTYTDNDRLTTDTYDANGNTTQAQDPRAVSTVTAGNVTDIYDFRNKLIRRLRDDQTEIDLSYDTDGNRVRKTVYTTAGAMKKDRLYLVDRNNHTGYAQVVEEMDGNGELVSKYLYGHDLVAMDDYSATPAARSYYQYDGLGSVRALTNENGEVTEEYDYDAYGILIEFRKLDGTSGQLESLSVDTFTETSNNRYLFTGEQFDTDLGMYYLRARYLNTNNGRFHNMDTYEGRRGEPLTLHKYLYAHSNPVSFIDPSGNVSLLHVTAFTVAASTLVSVSVHVGYNFTQGDDFFDIADLAIEGFTKHLGCLAKGSRPGSRSLIPFEEILPFAAAISPYALALKDLFKVKLPKWFRPGLRFGNSSRWSKTSSLLRAASVASQKVFGRHSLLSTGLRTIANAIKGRPGMTAATRARFFLGGTARVGAIGLMAATIVRTGDCLAQQAQNPN